MENKLIPINTQDETIFIDYILKTCLWAAKSKLSNEVLQQDYVT